MNHRSGSIVFGIVVGLAVAAWSYQWISDPDKRMQREQEEALVLSSRDRVSATLGLDGLEFVDPLAPQRAVGKVYIYPTDSGWEISGYYRRSEADTWHAYLLNVDATGSLAHLRVQDGDATVAALGAAEPRLEVVPQD